MHSDDAHKKPGQAATQAVDLAAISAAKLASGTAAAWHPDGIVAAESQGEHPGVVSLLVVEKERVSAGKVVVDGTAYVAPAPAGALLEGNLAGLYKAMQPTCLLQHCGGSDCAITVSAAAPDGVAVPPGCVALDAVQRMNLHVAHNTLYQFELLPRYPEPLVDIQVEAALLPQSMKLWEQIRDLQAGITPTVTSLPPPKPEAGSPTDPNIYLQRHGLVGICEQALRAKSIASVASESSREVYHALGDWFMEQAELMETSVDESDSGKVAGSDAHEVQTSSTEPESRQRQSEDCNVGVSITAAALRAALSKGYFQRCLSVAEKVVVVVERQAVLLRVQLVNDKTADEQAMQAVYHCHRGILTDETVIYVVAEKKGDGVGLRTVVPLEVQGAQPRPQFLSNDACNEDGVPYAELGPEAQPLHPSEIRVHTNDDEWFPVKRGLLKCCIALTQTLRDKDASSIRVDLDCLVRVTLLRLPNLSTTSCMPLQQPWNSLGCVSISVESTLTRPNVSYASCSRAS